MKTFSLLPVNFITEYAIQIGSMLEVLLLSLALADRIKILQEQNQKIEVAAQKKVITAEAESRAKKPPIPIVALTAHAMREHQQKSFDAGMNGRLRKPLEINQLSEVLQHYLTVVEADNADKLTP